MKDEYNADGLRIIKTARGEEAINAVAGPWYIPLVKPVKPSPDIKTKYAVFQNPETGKITEVVDYRLGSEVRDKIMVIDFTYYYPYHFESPYAAYMIPYDLKVGEKVFIEDLIEDIVGTRWNQSDTYRMPHCEAVWDGKNFELPEGLLEGDYTFIG